MICDLQRAREVGLLDGLHTDVLEACGEDSLTPLFATGRSGIGALRARVQLLLRADTPEGARARTVSGLLVAMRDRLQTIDAAIAESRAQIRQNPFNAQLRQQLLYIYREKRRTLEQIQDHDDTAL